MRNIGNIEDIQLELEQFYPAKIHSAMDFLIKTYDLDMHHAAHIASVVWQTLNFKNPWNLPRLEIYITQLNMN